MCNGKCLDLSFAATESEASAGIAQLSRCLATQGLPQHKAGDVKIALAEAINNVVEHAYADVTPAKVQVRCRLHRNWLDILISDTGHPCPGFRFRTAFRHRWDQPSTNCPKVGSAGT